MKYDANGLLSLALSAFDPYIRSRDPQTGRVVLVDPNDARRELVVTQREMYERAIIAASIMMAESGGDSDARCYNIDGPDGRPTCSPNPPAGPRGIDRGLWQWNNVAWGQRMPDGTPNPRAISDLAAFDPRVSTDIAFRVSNAYTVWQPWTGSRGLDPQSTPSQQIRRAPLAREWLAGNVTEEIPFTPIPVPDLSPVLGWADALGTVLTWLVNPDNWRRIGTGALGLLLVIGAVVAVVGPRAAQIAAAVR